MDSIQTILNLLQAGPTAVLIVGGMMEWYVWGPTYKRMIQERDDWKNIAIRSLSVAEKKP